MSYREFELENSKGQTWKLADPTVKSFLENPSGLGFQQSISTVRYGDALSVLSSDTNFPSVSGEVLFYDTTNKDKYDLYADFVTFCTFSPLILNYKKPQNNTDYYLNCEVSSLTKTEVKTDGILRCPVTFQGLSMWYEANSLKTGTGVGSFNITNNGHFPVGFSITINGNMTNPYITVSQNSQVYGEAKFDDTTPFSRVRVNSKDGEQSATLEQGGSVLPNPLSYQDLSISNGSIYVTFIKLARGTSTITIGVDSGTVTSYSMGYAPQYRSV